MRLRQHAWIVSGISGLVVGALLAVLGVWLVRETPPEPDPSGTLKIATGPDDSAGRWRHTLIAMWNAQHPEHPVEMVPLPPTADGQHAQMAAAAGPNSDVDVYNLDVTMIAEFARKKQIREVDQSLLPPGFLDGFLRRPLETCRYEEPDTLWALPLNTDAGLLFYRKDLVPRPPTQWTDVVNIAKQMTAQGSMATYVAQLRDYEGLTVNAMEAVWAEGGEIVSSDNKGVVVTREQMNKGVRRLIPVPGEPATTMHPNARGFDETSSRDAFAQGEALFMRNWPVQHSALLNNDNDSADLSVRERVPFSVGKLPGSQERIPGPSALGGQNLAIASTSKKPRTAQAFIEFMTQESSQLLLARYGGFAPTRKAPYKDEAVRKAYPYMPTLEESIESAKLRPVTPHYTNFSREFRRIVIHAMNNGGDPPHDFGETLTNALQGR
jgi:multiple sugar transport system substrate-binding protein